MRKRISPTLPKNEKSLPIGLGKRFSLTKNYQKSQKMNKTSRKIHLKNLRYLAQFQNTLESPLCSQNALVHLKTKGGRFGLNKHQRSRTVSDKTQKA